ncbi:MAG: porin [Prolixibacteraceae bacterium]|jgi:phosphate-selective porin OprO/OprP|nr:porin [Prolixibacteraceae bacterium]
MKLKKILPVLFLFMAMVFNGYTQGCAEPSSDEGVSVFGFIQPQLEIGFTDPSTSTFSFERARLGVMGNIPYDFTYYVVMEMSPFLSEEVPYPILLDAFISYTRYDYLKVSMGSFKSPFGLETNTPCSGLATIYRSKATLELNAPFRDLGLMFLGGSRETMLQYSVGLLNGTGLGHRDDNNFKDIVGRVGVNPLSWLHVGASFKYGQSASAAGLADPDIRTRLGGEFDMNLNGRLIVQGEYIYAKDEGSSIVGGGCSGGGEVVLGDKVRSGGYVQALYNLSYTIQPVVKFEFYDSDSNIKNNEEFVFTAGLNYFFNDWTRLQVNYRYAAEMPVDMPNDQLVLQLQVKF